ncbi:hypothetical protein PROFUN_00586 [Planoprotostelium fungivorum]|uniref:Uncharacterized protein n=1 Tax=Planoprotostelium fungivorum TaxID=1890364 RepID=A0A2P6N1A3_9EUKA|nr:hypothetical protein PROFUN_00586 [Planoprotostelium fungivorum]
MMEADILSNNYIRRYLRYFPEEHWPLVTKLTLIFGIQALQGTEINEYSSLYSLKTALKRKGNCLTASAFHQKITRTGSIREEDSQIINQWDRKKIQLASIKEKVEEDHIQMRGLNYKKTSRSDVHKPRTNDKGRVPSVTRHKLKTRTPEDAPSKLKRPFTQPVSSLPYNIKEIMTKASIATHKEGNDVKPNGQHIFHWNTNTRTSNQVAATQSPSEDQLFKERRGKKENMKASSPVEGSRRWSSMIVPQVEKYDTISPSESTMIDQINHLHLDDSQKTHSQQFAFGAHDLVEEERPPVEYGQLPEDRLTYVGNQSDHDDRSTWRGRSTREESDRMHRENEREKSERERSFQANTYNEQLDDIRGSTLRITRKLRDLEEQRRRLEAQYQQQPPASRTPSYNIHSLRSNFTSSDSSGTVSPPTMTMPMRGNPSSVFDHLTKPRTLFSAYLFPEIESSSFCR